MWALKAFRKVPSTRNYFEHIFHCLVPFFFFSIFFANSMFPAIYGL
jgi:hypothetical protein